MSEESQITALSSSPTSTNQQPGTGGEQPTSITSELGDFELVERDDLAAVEILPAEEQQPLVPTTSTDSLSQPSRICTQVSAETRRIEHNNKVLSELAAGDLVEYKRNLYSHWAVYIGRAKIIHLHGENEGPLMLSGVAILPSVSRAQVVMSSFWDCVKDSYVYRNNSLDSQFNPLPVDQILARAYEKVSDANYNVFWYNCEHFAKYCRYGVETSGQAAGVMQLLKVGYTVTNGLRNLETKCRKMLGDK
jgi:hypothetical protein